MSTFEINDKPDKSIQQKNIHKVHKKETLYSISKKYGVSVDALREYNGIKENNTINAGQTLKIPPKSTPKTNTSIMSCTKHVASNEKEITFLPDEDSVPPSTPSVKSPNAIASELKQLSKHIAAVGDDDFTQTLNLINKDNVIDVIKEYNRISPKESLIDMICSEVMSKQKARKDAVNHVMSALCEKVGSEIATDEKKASFTKELEDQFDSWGFVSTKKMDEQMNTIISDYEKMLARKAQEARDKRVVKIGKTTTTSGALRISANKFAETQDISNKRPDPVIDKNGNIIANVKVIKPLNKGDLDGKTIIINAGHGGYNPNNGAFDAGTSGKNSDGKTVEEWQTNDAIVKKLIPLLTMNGAKVVYMSGTAANIMDAKSKYNADLFISIHCDNAPNKPERRGQSIIFRDSNKNNEKLAQLIETNIEKDKSNIDSDNCVSKEDDRGLGVLKVSSSIPSVLIETGFLSNKKDMKNLQNAAFQAKLAQNIASGISEYFSDLPKTQSLQKHPATIEASMHEIKKGESLSVIESKYGLRSGELAYVNNINPSQGIKAGQKLRIPERYNVGNPQNIDDVAKIFDFKPEFIKDLINYEGHKGVDIHKIFGDSVGNPTIGYGHLINTNFEKKYYKNRTLSDSQVYALLAKDLIKAENAIRLSIGSENYERLSQPQKQAVVDFVFSRGSGTFNSDACAQLRNGLINGDYDKAAANLTYNRSIKTGKVMNGLTKRRLYEMAMFAGDDKSETVLKAARKLFKEGLKAGKAEKLNKGTMDAYVRDVNEWFDGKL